MKRTELFKGIFWKVETYWLILIVGFTTSALLLWFWFIPNGLEYNLGVNLFTSSLFMVFTIVFLSWLFTIREKRLWKPLEKDVYDVIGIELGLLFYGILDFVENGYEIQSSIIDTPYKAGERDKRAFVELCKLRDSKDLRFNAFMLKLFLEDENQLELLTSVKKRLGDTQLKFWRFLTPRLARSLMHLETNLELIENIVQSNAIARKLPSNTSRILVERTNLVVQSTIKISIKGLIEQIYNINKMGIKLSMF